MGRHILEPAAQRFADATAKPPFLYELGAEGARKVLDDVQAAPIAKPDVDERWITVSAAVKDDVLAVAVYDVTLYQRPFGVGVELDAPIGVVVDEVVGDLRAS